MQVPRYGRFDCGCDDVLVPRYGRDLSVVVMKCKFHGRDCGCDEVQVPRYDRDLSVVMMKCKFQGTVEI